MKTAVRQRAEKREIEEIGEPPLKKPLKKNVSEIKQEASINIDYPQENEKVRPGYYAIRISTKEPGDVEVSINNGDWKQCRPALGYCWFDWWPYTEGPYLFLARETSPDGKVQTSLQRSCQVTDEILTEKSGF